jgi:hypothetical protein
MKTDDAATEPSNGNGHELITTRGTPLVQLGTLQANSPAALVAGATAIADTLADVIRQKKLTSRINGKDFVRVEGWTVLGALLGVIAREESVLERDDGSYLATVTLVRMADNVVVSRASAECGMDEERWAGRPKYARRSMALTRATGKAARLAFSWIMSLAGFEPTPAEEMDGVVPTETVDKQTGEIHTDVVPSGKHRGKPWKDIVEDYLIWAVSAERCPEALKEGCQRELNRRERERQSAVDEGDIPYDSPREEPARAKAEGDVPF